MRKFGAELEILVVDENGIPITWSNWLNLKSEFSKLIPSKKEIRDMTGTYLGYEIPGLGTIGLDSSAALFEIGIEPSNDVDSAMEKILKLLEITEKALNKKNFKILWKSQYPGLIDRENYNLRFSRRGLYPILRKIWGWHHHELYLSASFQPAIDVDPSELARVLNAIFVTSPIFIREFGGNGRFRDYFEYRLKAWELMIRDSEVDRDMLGIPGKIQDVRDYLDKLLSIRAKILGNYKHGERIFFIEPIRAHEVLKGTTGQRLAGVRDMERDEFDYEDIHVEGKDLIMQMDWWVFWDARWRFGKRNGRVERDYKNVSDLVLNEIDYSYIEIRHIGTPSSPAVLRRIFISFSNLFENSGQVLKLAEKFDLYSNLNLARELVIKSGILPENHEKVREILKKEGVLT